MAFGLTVLLGCGAMVTDVGLIYAEKAKLQNAVDAAALAGVQELPNNPVTAAQIAQDYAQQNGADNKQWVFCRRFWTLYSKTYFTMMQD